MADCLKKDQKNLLQEFNDSEIVESFWRYISSGKVLSTTLFFDL